MKAVFLIVAVLFAVLFVIDRFAPEQPPAALATAGGGGNPETGRQLFRGHCAECHGQELEGSDKGPPLLHPYYHPNHHGDLAFQLAVRDGVVQHHWHFGNMPPVPALTPEQVRDITAWVRAEQQRAGIF